MLLLSQMAEAKGDVEAKLQQPPPPWNQSALLILFLSRLLAGLWEECLQDLKADSGKP